MPDTSVRWRFLLGGMLGCLILVLPAWADIGPSFGPGKIAITVTFRDRTPDGDLRAALLAPDLGGEPRAVVHGGAR